MVSREVLEIINNKLKNVQYGEISLKIQKGKIIDVVTTDRVRVGD
jgi:hypothetical protein